MQVLDLVFLLLTQTNACACKGLPSAVDLSPPLVPATWAPRALPLFLPPVFIPVTKEIWPRIRDAQMSARHRDGTAARRHSGSTMNRPRMCQPHSPLWFPPKSEVGKGPCCPAEDVHPPAATTHPKGCDRDERRLALPPALPVRYFSCSS